MWLEELDIKNHIRRDVNHNDDHVWLGSREQESYYEMGDHARDQLI